MVLVKCRSCGRQYDYSKDDCCPRCGAYNRPPRHERVDADGTVHHLTDAEYAARGHAGSEKVCFEEKTCFEDEARPKISQRKRAATPAGRNKRTGPLIALLIAVVISCAAVIARLVVSESRTEEPTVWTEPSDGFGETAVTEPDDDKETTLFFIAEDGSSFTLLDWWCEDSAIAVELAVDFADSDHEFYASLVCIGENGYAVTLTSFETGGDKTDVLRFFTEGEVVTPQTFVLEDWDPVNEDGPVAVWEAQLEA